MLVLYGVLLFLISAAFFIAVPLLWAHARAIQIGEARTIICPETHQPATVSADGTRAARAELAGGTDLLLIACSRWPRRKGCDQACVPQFPLVGDDRRLTHYAPFALEPRLLRINNPVRMSRALYDRLASEFARAADRAHGAL